jgi:hypothetical protein
MRNLVLRFNVRVSVLAKRKTWREKRMEEAKEVDDKEIIPRWILKNMFRRLSNNGTALK